MSQALKRFLFLCILTTTGCELTEVTVVDVEDLVVAEVYVVVAEDLNNNQVKASYMVREQVGCRADALLKMRW